MLEIQTLRSKNFGLEGPITKAIAGKSGRGLALGVYRKRLCRPSFGLPHPYFSAQR
jgi:hypothetical protein